MMKNIFLLLLLFFTTFAVNAQNDIVVDPNASLRNVPGNFNAITISGGIDLYLSQHNQEAIAVSAADEKFRENIKTNIENNVLHIYYQGDKRWNMQKKKLRVYVSFKNLVSVHASGACDIVVAGSITVPSLILQLSGASDFKGNVEVAELKLNLSGASDVHLSGTAGKVFIESTGASDVRGFGLVSDYCTAKASGASDISITVNKELNAHASGASNIIYIGSALIKDLQRSGSGNVSRKGS